jgi:hypothetical protein
MASENEREKVKVYLGSDYEIVGDEKRVPCYSAWTAHRDRCDAVGDCADIVDFRAGWLYGYDAGAASAAAWVRIESEQDLPKVEGSYWFTRKSDGQLESYYFQANQHSVEYVSALFVAWTPKTYPEPYQPTEANEK